MKQALLAHVLLVCSLATAAHAQCDGAFLPGPDQQYPGIKGTVLASTSWDPDGAGPQPSLLIVGGSFTIAGESLASNIAAWDGEHWLPLGTGTSGPVYALSSYRGELVAAGHFMIAGGVSANHIARWNGSQWRSLGTGITSAATINLNLFTAAVTALAVFEDELVVGGNFTAAGGEPASSIARWDGGTWRPLGSGITSIGARQVHALHVHAGELFAGGLFTSAGETVARNVARWDGAQWHALDATILNDRVYSFASHQGDLVIGGNFEDLGQNQFFRIIRWNHDGYQRMGTFPVLPGSGIAFAPVHALVSHREDLYAGGDFFVQMNAPPITWPFYTARWDGSEWGPIADDLPLPYAVKTFAIHDGMCVATTLSARHNVRVRLGAEWISTARGVAKLSRVAVYHGELIGGGSMQEVGGPADSAVARLTGDGWDRLGLWQYGSGIQSLAIFNDRLVVGGYGGVGAATALGAGVLQWDGTEWSAVGPMPEGVIDFVNVRAMAVCGDSLVAAGQFPFIGDIATSNIARWDGAAWHAMGAGLPNPVSALTSFGGDCIAVSPSNTVKRFDGTAWQVVGGSMSATVHAVMSYQNELVAAGVFSSAGGNAAPHIARWSGDQWLPLGDGLPHPVFVLTTLHGELVALGTTPAPNNQLNGYLSRWNGNGWITTTFITDGSISGAVEYNNQLIIAGEFTTIDGRVSAYWARWSLPTADFNHDGDVGTDLDIEAFFACLAGQCCPACSTADFNADGDFGTDADIESFFRILAGGPC